MIASVVAARACIEANERLLLATRHRIKVSLRHLYYPGFKIRGGSGSEVDEDPHVRRIVRTLLTSGRGRAAYMRPL